MHRTGYVLYTGKINPSTKVETYTQRAIFTDGNGGYFYKKNNRWNRIYVPIKAYKKGETVILK